MFCKTEGEGRDMPRRVVTKTKQYFNWALYLAAIQNSHLSLTLEQQIMM